MAPDQGDDRAEARPVVPVPRGPESTPVFSPARLRAWRHLRDVPVTRLADKASTSPTYVSECETGLRQPDTATITAWASALNCQTDQLCSPTPDGAGEYWKAASEAMEPMTTQDLAVVADVILRGRARRTGHGKIT